MRFSTDRPSDSGRRVRPLLATLLLVLLMLGTTLSPAQAEDIGPVYQEEDWAQLQNDDQVLSLQGFSPEHSRVIDTSRDKPNLFLTFDDGSSMLTPDLLDMLERYPDVSVTFFVNCREEMPGTYQRILDAGHALGNHTCNHEYLNRMNTLGRQSQFTKLQSYVDARLRGPVAIGCYRPPFGATNDSLRADAARMGLWEWTWSIDPRDWEKPGVENILTSLERMRDGDIIVMHDSNGKEQTVEAVRQFLAAHADDHLFRTLPRCAQTLPFTWQGRFMDDDGSVFESDIEWLAESGVAKGCGENRFCPEEPVTRGQMAAFLARALHAPGSSVDAFSDDAGLIFEPDINRLAATGVVRGCAEQRYCPGDNVTRGQMAAFLVRTLNLPASNANAFTDDDGSVFEADIQALAASGIIKGCNPPANDRFCPEEPIARGQMAALLHRALK